MEINYERCCGIDVHKKVIVACLIRGGKQELRRFGTTTKELRGTYVPGRESHQETMRVPGRKKAARRPTGIRRSKPCYPNALRQPKT